MTAASSARGVGFVIPPASGQGGPFDRVLAALLTTYRRVNDDAPAAPTQKPPAILGIGEPGVGTLTAAIGAGAVIGSLAASLLVDRGVWLSGLAPALRCGDCRSHSSRSSLGRHRIHPAGVRGHR